MNFVNSLGFVILVICAAAEIASRSNWNEKWLRWGPVIRTWRIGPKAGAIRLTSMEQSTQRSGWKSLEFHRFSPQCIGFRESGFGFGVPHIPLMRGEIVVDPATAEIKVAGRANFVFFGLAAFFLGTGGADTVVLTVLVLGINIAIQSVRFGHVVSALRELPDGGSSAGERGTGRGR